LQGENRILVRVHDNHEYTTASGITIPNTEKTQDIETTGEVVAISPKFDSESYPDIRPGINVKVILNSWHTFPYAGGQLAICSAEYVIAAYESF